MKTESNPPYLLYRDQPSNKQYVSFKDVDDYNRSAVLNDALRNYETAVQTYNNFRNTYADSQIHTYKLNKSFAAKHNKVTKLYKYTRDQNPAVEKILQNTPIKPGDEDLNKKYDNAYGNASRIVSEAGVIKKNTSDYKIPLDPNRNITLRSGGKVNKNVIDALYKASIDANVPFGIALGLAARETGLGQVRQFGTTKKYDYINNREVEIPSIDQDALISNWQQSHTIYIPNSKAARLRNLYDKYIKGQKFSEEETKFFNKWYPKAVKEYAQPMRTVAESPLVNGLKFFAEGKYDGGNDSRHFDMVKRSADEYLADPFIRVYLNKMHYDVGDYKNFKRK